MPTSADRCAADTSVAVAALDAAHASHVACRDVVRSRRPALAGHAAFETLSVLTRMPGALAVDPPTASALIARVFPEVVWLAKDDVAALIERLGVVGISGGAVYDALVGEAARVHGCTLLTRDRRAVRTYDLLGVQTEFVGV
jgi:predicted nucleic acid-binding protein